MLVGLFWWIHLASGHRCVLCLVYCRAATNSKFCTQVLSHHYCTLKRVLFLGDKYNKMCHFPLKINRNLPSLCHFYQESEWFLKGHYMSVKEYSFVHFVLKSFTNLIFNEYFNSPNLLQTIYSICLIVKL